MTEITEVDKVEPSDEASQEANPGEHRKMTEITEVTKTDPSNEKRQPSSKFRQSKKKLRRRIEEEFSDDDKGVPLERSRNGTWWYATVHNITAIVGSGVLGLPTAMVYLGWTRGIIVLVMSWVITLFTLWQMVQMYEIKGKRRSSTYYELGQKALGEKRGLWIVLSLQLAVFIGADIVYMATGGQSLWLFYQLIRCNVYEKRDYDTAALGSGDQCCGNIGRSTFTVFFALLQLLLAQLDGLNSIASVSMLASLMSICYCIIASVLSVKQGYENHSHHFQPLSKMQCSTSYHIPDMKPEHQVFGAFSALGVVATAYAGHSVVLEIQETLPSSKEKPSKGPMWWGVVVAYIIVALCYFPVAIFGYWAFGNSLGEIGNTKKNPGNGNILLQLGHPLRLIAAANLMVFVHVTGSYLVYAMPAFDVMEKILLKKTPAMYLIENLFTKFGFQRPEQKRSVSVMRLVSRSIYVCLTAFVACTFPFFQALLAVFGGVAFTATTYFMPCIIWLLLKKPPSLSAFWFLNWFCIVTGGLLMLCAIIGGIWSMVNDSSHGYKFYQLFHCIHDNGYKPSCSDGVYFT